jgi:GNAT superfamily N-acetyltransferase
MLTDRLPTALAEGAEAEIMYRYEDCAAAVTKAALGISTARMGGGVVLSMSNDVTGYWSKALGFGFEEPVTAALIDRVIDYFRTQASPSGVIQIAPDVLPPDWLQISRRHGLRADSEWYKLGRAIGEGDGDDSDPRITRIRGEDADEWAAVTIRGFGMPSDLIAMMAASAADPDTRPFTARANGETAAAANLFIYGEVGALSAAATLPEYRNQGLQSALINARIAEAARAGCTWVVAETGKPADGEVNHSLNNLMRSGLRPLYARQNWVWTP